MDPRRTSPPKARTASRPTSRTPEAGLLAGGALLLAVGLACLLARARGAEALASDKVTLKDGKVVEGEVLDLTEKKVVVAAGKDGKERKTYSRAQVASIERSAPENVLQLCERKLKSLAGSKSLEDWKGLALFCEKQKLHPERRRALREILKIDPENREARLALGHASLDGRWLDEDEVELKLKEGFELADGKLVRKTSTTTVAKVDAPPDRYVILEGQKLSPAARKKLDKERETRLKSADRFLAGKEKEYAGVPWSERHKIQTRFFEIHCNSTRKVADAYGLLMEMIRAKLSEMFQSEIKRNFRAPVFIYSSQEEFMSQDQLGRWMGRGLGGYYNPATQAITAFHGTFGFTGTTFGVLCHEGTHYFQGLVLQDFDNIPMWLIEGLAVYFGDGSAFDAQKRKITVGLIPRDRLAHIQEKMLLARHTPVKKLVSMTRRDGFNGSHYADAWALIYFLVKSGKKGELLLMEYWAKGLKARLEKKDFLDLADKHFGGVEALEKQYVAYTLKLDMPPAGKVLGDYFVSDTFQFDYKAPGEDWQFFEDRDDKKLLVGMLAPSGKGEIRVYYKNNELWLKPDKYMEGYLRTVPQFKDLKRDQVKSGKLQWEKLTYLDDGSDPPAMTIVMSEEEGIPRVEVIKAKKDDKAKKAPSDVVRYLLIQDDGVVEVECSAPQGQGAQLAEVFDVAHESFTMTFTRRW